MNRNQKIHYAYIIHYKDGTTKFRCFAATRVLKKDTIRKRLGIDENVERYKRLRMWIVNIKRRKKKNIANTKKGGLTIKELDYICNNRGTKTIREMAIHLKRSEGSVANALRRFGITNKASKEERMKRVVLLYKEGKILKAIAKELNCSVSTIIVTIREAHKKGLLKDGEMRGRKKYYVSKRKTEKKRLKHNERMRKFYARNSEKIIKRCLEYYRKNKERLNKQTAERLRRQKAELRERLEKNVIC